MDTTSQHLSSSLQCELRIIRAKNIEFVPAGNLFVRCYLITGNGKRIRLNSREIPSMFDPYWNEFIMLECGGGANATEELKQQSVVFELRWRNNTSVLGRIVGSKLLGRAEIPWEDVLESTNMSMEKWVTVSTASSALIGLKPPALEVGMKIRVPKVMEKASRRTMASSKRKGCGCRDGDCCRRYEDMFAIGAAIEVL
ncbi:uncharacterized protein LOC143848966 [Tasmannia lanceolata]|uniref:uncharacterized protein LOC143848966 n=1 Tax=Tasmannia lanceolata TaxID=3420 RepID=UPI004062BB69